jgi:hypothetical protein
MPTSEISCLLFDVIGIIVAITLYARYEITHDELANSLSAGHAGKRKHVSEGASGTISESQPVEH